jgi:mannose-6-phosphate isomerase-like protein (cupin superfamily)
MRWETAMLTRYRKLSSFVTKDGSEIRELMHPAKHACRHQSLAEARVAPGAATTLHRHRTSEELYHITAGEGVMTLGGRRFAVQPGDTVAIAPGTAHRIENTGRGTLVVLCCCSPPYSDQDTELLPS